MSGYYCPVCKATHTGSDKSPFCKESLRVLASVRKKTISAEKKLENKKAWAKYAASGREGDWKLFK
jgi:hypothetical protein